MNSLLKLEPLLTPIEAAAILQISVGTLAVWRATKRYPLAYIKVGRSVRYRKSAVEEFITTNQKGVAG
jgi:excisionase family DNA binding protein